MMYISGAKFEEHCSNISGDINDSVFYLLFACSFFLVAKFLIILLVVNVITSLICIIQKRKYL